MTLSTSTLKMSLTIKYDVIFYYVADDAVYIGSNYLGPLSGDFAPDHPYAIWL